MRVMGRIRRIVQISRWNHDGAAGSATLFAPCNGGKVSRTLGTFLCSDDLNGLRAHVTQSNLAGQPTPTSYKACTGLTVIVPEDVISKVASSVDDVINNPVGPEALHTTV